MSWNDFWKEFFEEYIKEKSVLGFILAIFNTCSFILSISWMKGKWIPLIGITLSICTLVKFTRKGLSKIGPITSLICYCISTILFIIYKSPFIHFPFNVFILLAFISVLISIISSYINFRQPKKFSRNQAILYWLLSLSVILCIVDFLTFLSVFSAIIVFIQFILNDDFLGNSINYNNSKSKKINYNIPIPLSAGKRNCIRNTRNIQPKLINSRKDIVNFDISVLCSGAIINLFSKCYFPNSNYYNLVLALIHPNPKIQLIDVFQHGIYLFMAMFFISIIVINRIS